MNGYIRVDGAGKAYRRYARKADKWLEVLSMGLLQRHQLQWVLHPLQLEVAPGQCVGLIGYNGAGKSTLLKLVAGVTPSTTGAIFAGGRIAAILELGVGFHFDLTGRQNIPLTGQLLGHSAAQMAACSGDILAFAELGDMIDQPLRAYSSGMLARLAFAIATAVRPDILIVDEALSVGDAYFQHKSFARIREFKAAGTTTLFVSHDFTAVRALCDRVVLFDGGKLLMDASAEVVLDYYNALIASREKAAGIQQEQATDEDGGARTVTRSGTGEVTLTRVGMLDAQGAEARRFATGDTATVNVLARVHTAVDSLVAGIMIRDRTGNPIYGTNSWHLQQPLLHLDSGTDASLRFELPLNLGDGSYSLSVALHDKGTHLSSNYDWRDNLLVFEVVNLTHPPFVGVVLLPTVVEATSSRAGTDGDAPDPGQKHKHMNSIL